MKRKRPKHVPTNWKSDGVVRYKVKWSDPERFREQQQCRALNRQNPISEDKIAFLGIPGDAKFKSGQRVRESDVIDRVDEKEATPKLIRQKKSAQEYRYGSIIKKYARNNNQDDLGPCWRYQVRWDNAKPNWVSELALSEIAQIELPHHFKEGDWVKRKRCKPKEDPKKKCTGVVTKQIVPKKSTPLHLLGPTELRYEVTWERQCTQHEGKSKKTKIKEINLDKLKPPVENP